MQVYKQDWLDAWQEMEKEPNINLQSLPLHVQWIQFCYCNATPWTDQSHSVAHFHICLASKKKSKQFVNIRCESENRVNTDMQQIYFSLIYHKSERKRNLSKQDDKAIALCSYQDKSNSLQFKMAPSFIQNNLSLQY